jgi:hypothetical protein
MVKQDLLRQYGKGILILDIRNRYSN